ncbi:hypothetical protein DICSQDRAFT_140272 [Dichomitus squalens LYAD-421 SS1]|uniref:Uncharacterized protein n=1 Tax=Dichomitus squalens (strain LYAD-421) TaxID=732165 RepID=R7SNT7_DICSQ|nr:uncharacterized protein DICSQDRAFT_140272 [Dichomitus squalens LYAD-421 SS1]EJF57598.1 hypothetical protein DICSQDRAFT_140272 [Dichomitus squalens LYAD-421 SS1]
MARENQAGRSSKASNGQSNTDTSSPLGGGKIEQSTPAGPHPPSPPESPKLSRATLSRIFPGSSHPNGEGKSKLGKHDTDGVPSSTDATGASTSAYASSSAQERNPTATAVSDLLRTMHSTLGALENTFEVLGQQTLRVASLGPAVDALYQIKEVQGELLQQHEIQEARMQDVEERLQEQVKAHFREMLRPRVDEIVAACVKNVIEERVRQQLAIQIPATLRAELKSYRQQIVEAKVKLYNSEARRHNALIRSSGLHEPLRPLLRSLGAVGAEPGTDADADADRSADADGRPDKEEDKDKERGKEKAKQKQDNKTKGKDENTPRGGASSTAATVGTSTGSSSRGARPGGGDTTRKRLEVDTSASSARTGAGATAASPNPPTAAPVDLGIAPGWDIAPPTPSPFFPRNVATLVSLSEAHARTLVREYGLVQGDERAGEGGTQGAAAAGAGSGRGAGRGANSNAKGGRGSGGGRGSRNEGRTGSGGAEDGEASSWANAGLEGSREDYINRFMKHIGVSGSLVMVPCADCSMRAYRGFLRWDSKSFRLRQPVCRLSWRDGVMLSVVERTSWTVCKPHFAVCIMLRILLYCVLSWFSCCSSAVIRV